MTATHESIQAVSQFSSVATEADILACFRLILGRDMNPEERAGHLDMAGQDLASVLPIYLQSIEFVERKLMGAQRTDDVQAVQLDGFQLLASASDSSIGRHVLSGSYEPHVSSIFRRFVSAGMTVVDVGANIGYFSMLAASLVGHTGQVLAIEPNGANVRLIEASRRLNDFKNLQIAQVAAGKTMELLMLNAGQSNGTTNTLADDLDVLLSSTSVQAIPIDQLARDLRRIDFLKIDVEGAELNAILGAEATIQRDRPTIVTEFAPGQLVGISGITGEEYLRWFIDHGYELSVVKHDCTTTELTTEVASIMGEYQLSGVDHIDVLAICSA